MSTNAYCQYFAYGFLGILAAAIMFFLASTAMWPAEAQRYTLFGLGAAGFGILMLGIGIWQKKGEDTAPKQEIASDDEGWSSSS
jgi:hypothetical protein